MFGQELLRRKIFQRLLSLTAITLATMSCTNASMFNSEPQFTVKAVKNKAFDESCLIDAFKISNGSIADCLEHCLKNCRCQSFQICEKTKCQLCSSHKDENSSLLHENVTCVYAMYEMRHLTETFQKLKDQCLDISCSTKYNCCQQSDLCPKNKTCKPVNCLQQPWKRFRCECRDGYHGSDCEQPITSCQGYAKVCRKSGIYKVVDSTDGSLYEVYCHFDSDGAWTLVQSYSFANGTNGTKFQAFRRSLSENLPVSENALTWSGYRLSKARMESIKNYSTFLLFTCEYEKHLDLNKSDYVQIGLLNIGVDILEFKEYTSNVTISEGCGKIGEYDLSHCKIQLHQKGNKRLHVRIRKTSSSSKCKFPKLSCSNRCKRKYFGNYENPSRRVKQVHRCVQNHNSTTQLWFGVRKPNT